MKTMKRLDKERRKLEKVGFSGQTLERAMELLERTNASILSELLVKMVTRQEKNALHGAVRDGDQNAGTGGQTGTLAQGAILNISKIKQRGVGRCAFSPLLFCAGQSLRSAVQSKIRPVRGSSSNSYFMPSRNSSPS